MAEIFTVTRLEIDAPEHCKYLLLSHLVPVTHRFVICAAESLHVHALIRNIKGHEIIYKTHCSFDALQFFFSFYYEKPIQIK